MAKKQLALYILSVYAGELGGKLSSAPDITIEAESEDEAFNLFGELKAKAEVEGKALEYAGKFTIKVKEGK